MTTAISETSDVSQQQFDDYTDTLSTVKNVQSTPRLVPPQLPEQQSSRVLRPRVNQPSYKNMIATIEAEDDPIS
ncbi:hypothetical protein GZH46_00542, partial [Fragariocoptes setiger]